MATGEIWTIQRLLSWITDYLTQKNVDSPRLSAELLLADVLAMKRIELYMHFDKPVEQAKLDTLRDLVKRAGEQEPVAYLVGRSEFYGMDFEITRDCLIPRPETELLVERAVEFLRQRTGKQFVCDLCTGCGCIAVAIARNYPDCLVLASDISPVALAIAAENAKRHTVLDKIKFLSGDLFDPVIPEIDVNKFNLIVSNPPYVTASEYERLDKNVKDYEPRQALYGGSEGLDIISKVIGQAPSFLKAGGAVMLEIGYGQGQAVRGLFDAAGCFADIKIEKDFHNNDRIASAVMINPA